MSLATISDMCTVGPGWDSLICTMRLALMRPFTTGRDLMPVGDAAPEIVADGLGLILSGCGVVLEGSQAFVSTYTNINPMTIGFVLNVLFLVVYFWWKYRLAPEIEDAPKIEKPEVTAQRRDENTEQLIASLRDNARRAEIHADGLTAELQLVRRTLNRRDDLLRQLGVRNYATGAPIAIVPPATAKADPRGNG